jgi:hypothetical protein
METLNSYQKLSFSKYLKKEMLIPPRNLDKVAKPKKRKKKKKIASF